MLSRTCVPFSKKKNNCIFVRTGSIALRLPVPMRQQRPGVRAGSASHPRRMWLLSRVRPTGRRPLRWHSRVRSEKGFGVPVRRLLQPGRHMQR